MLRRVERTAQFARRPLRPDLYVAIAEDRPLAIIPHEEQALARLALGKVILDERQHVRFGQGARQGIDRRVDCRVRQEDEEAGCIGSLRQA